MGCGETVIICRAQDSLNLMAFHMVYGASMAGKAKYRFAVANQSAVIRMRKGSVSSDVTLAKYDERYVVFPISSRVAISR